MNATEISKKDRSLISHRFNILFIPDSYIHTLSQPLSPSLFSKVALSVSTFAQIIDSPGTKVPLVSDDGRQVPEELKPLHDYYEKWNKESVGTWSNRVSEKVRDIWALNPKLKISQCIVVGLGSLDNAMQIEIPPSDTQDKPFKDGTGYPIEVKQFIAARMTMDYIKEVAHPIKTYFQDPRFTKLDKAYLEYHGYKVLEGDSGFDMVDSKTLLFNMNCANQIPQWPVALKAPPAVYVGTSFESIIESWTAEKQHNASSRDKYFDPEAFMFDTKPMEDYINITDAYSFPSLGNQDSLQFPEATVATKGDRGAFNKFAIRVVKTVHTDHQPS